MIREIINFLRPVYWPFVKVYLRTLRRNSLGTKIVLSHKNEILFVKHTYGKKYSFPGGGLKKGEDPEEGVRREIREELGIELDKIIFLETYIPDIKFEYRRNEITVFAAELPCKDIEVDSFEILDTKWLSPDNPPPLGHVAMHILNLYKARK